MVLFSRPLARWFARSYPRDAAGFFETVFSIGLILMGAILIVLGLMMF